MKKILGLCLLVLAPLVATAVENGQVLYVGGTSASVKEGVLGRLDTTSHAALNFEYSGGRLVIPFEMVDSYEYSQPVARHLGVLPAIAVGLVRRRQRKHFFRISYHDENKSPQVAVFEVSKEMPPTLLAVLKARAPQGCKPQAAGECGVLPNWAR
jgi:hypothetical protein